MDIFEHLQNLTVLKREVDFTNDEVRKSYNKYMINRFVSMCEYFIPFVNEINKYDLPDSAHYDYFLNVLPKQKLFFNYIKKKKDLNEEERSYIADYFECGKNDAIRYISILDEDQIQEILNIYLHGNNKRIEI